MSLLQKLTEDMKLAMKSGQKDRLQVIRMLMSDLKVIDMNPAKPTELQVVEGYAKKLRKSIEEYQRLGKPDEVKALVAEVAVVEEYLPKKASAEQTAQWVDVFLSENAFTEKDAGKATGLFMKKHGSEADAGLASGIIRQKLAGK